MGPVRPDWLFDVASVFQRAALPGFGHTADTLLCELRDAISPPASALEQLIVDGFMWRATRSLRASQLSVNRVGAVEDRAVDILELRFSERLTYRQLGRELGYDPEYLEVRFRRKTGRTLHAYLRAVRVRKALEAIRQGEKIEAAALQVGFRSKSGFLRAFRTITGTTPRHLR